MGLALLGGLPAALALAWIVWGQDYSFEVRWTLAAVVLVVVDRAARSRRTRW